MIIHVTAYKDTNDIWQAYVEGANGVYATGNDLDQAAARVRSIALHYIAESISIGECAAPWSISFVLHVAKTNEAEPLINIEVPSGTEEE